MESKDLEKIKKYYGEDFAHYCRVFSTILDTATEENPTPLFNLLYSLFYPNKSLYEDLVNQKKLDDFKNHVFANFSFYVKKQAINAENPYDLMRKAGYSLYKCETYKDTLKFQKYYKHKEEICTFKDKERTNNCLVFFAIKDGTTLDGINGKKRKDFVKPNRQDEYGTSVISIQFSKGKFNTLSIKNRYNHTVINPDSTFSNDLDNIIPGLTESFIKAFNLNITNVNEYLRIEKYHQLANGKYIKYNIMNYLETLYCPNNIFVDHDSIYQYDKGRFELIDCFLIDKQNKTLECLVDIHDSFVDDLQNFKKIDIVREKNNRKLIITKNDGNEAIIIVNKNNQIIGYKNKTLTNIGDCFLSYNETLTELNLPSLKTIGQDFLARNDGLTKLSLPSLQKIGDRFLKYNHTICKLDLPNLTEIGDYFLWSNYDLESISLPSLKTAKNGFIECNTKISYVDLPNLTTVGHSFLCYNRKLEKLYLPNLENMGLEFLFTNTKISDVKLPKLKGNIYEHFYNKVYNEHFYSALIRFMDEFVLIDY